MLTNDIVARAGFTLRWAPRTLGFLQYFPAKYRRPTKVLYERGATGTVPYVKSIPGYCITFIKRLHEGLT